MSRALASGERAAKDLSARIDRFLAPRLLAAIAVAAFHLAVAVFVRVACGVDIAIEAWRNWDFFWQDLPLSVLAADPVSAILHLHMQPPVWNLVGLGLAKLAGESLMSAIDALNVGLGAAMSAMALLLMRCCGSSPRWAFAGAVAMATSPALLLYEAYASYPVLTAFWVALAGLLGRRAQQTGEPVAAVGFVVALNLLVLTRSLYHPVLLAFAFAWLAVSSVRMRPRHWLAAAAVTVPALAWLLKNVILFGFLGTSSWLGWNAWHMVSASYPTSQLRDLHRAGVLDEVVLEIPAFRAPSLFRSYGFGKTSPVEALSRDDFNNVNVVAISRLYGANAWRLIRRDPQLYFARVAKGALHWSYPASRYEQLEANRLRIGGYETLVAGHLLGADWAWWNGRLRPLSPTLLAVALVASAQALRLYRSSPDRWRSGCVDLVCGRSRWFWPAAFCLYNLAVGSLFEFGENERFKFDVVVPGTVLLMAWLEALTTRRRRLSGGATTDVGAEET